MYLLQVCIGDLGLGWGGDVVRMDGDGNDSCGRDWRLKILFVTFRLHFGNILEVFFWILGASGFRLGSD